jgi:predicted DNA-binding protein (UPF0251 family)
VQRIKKEVLSGKGFTQGQTITRRIKAEPEISTLPPADSMERIWNEVKYLRQEVEFLKKLKQIENATKRKK